jgi:hypothetical protein
MKRPFTIYDLPVLRGSTAEGGRFTICGKSAKSAAVNHQSSIINHKSQQGVALIITVILLAVVTFMALTFLAISRRERGAVTTTTDTASARLAADDALASVEAQIVANILATTNPYNFGLLVSTNYINSFGFQPGIVSPTNVNYDYLSGGGLLNQGEFLQNLANLYYNPRPPVFIQTNATGPLDFRFYLDLNRNGRDEPNGLVLDTNSLGQPTGNTFPNMVGDPEWIGVLLHPDQPYGPNNPFVARYAFIAVPIGNALDLNAIYNEAITRQVSTNSGTVNDGYMRDQGVGSWEINLAAFLTDLNTNQWDPPTVENVANNPYNYREWQTPNFANTGAGFEDALSLLSYRYDFNYRLLATADQLFPNAANVFPNDNIDAYTTGPLLNGFQLLGDNDNPTLSWVGADNPNQFFDLQELFNTGETAVGVAPAQITAGADLSGRLLSAGNSVSTYDRYTYYRLASQMGVESAPEQDKINLNYSNAAAYFDANGVVTNITFFPGAETNFIPWTPLQFFTIAADKMLREYSQAWLAESPSNYVLTYGMTTNIGTVANPTNIPVPFGITSIPVVVSNQFVYTPAVQRVLQLAANIYDATTNNTAVERANFPSVFRPTFDVVPIPGTSFTNVYINGYQQVGTLTFGTNDPQLRLPIEVTELLPGLSAVNYAGLNGVNVYGVPWIIGAKKGFPNFNKFDMESAFQLTRKLQVTRQSTNDSFVVDPSHYGFNQMFILSLSNQFGVDCWNSYTNGYNPNNDSMAIYVRDNLKNAALTNDQNFFADVSIFPIAGSIQIPSGNVWPGYNALIDPIGSQSFQIPLYTNVMVITNSMYRFNSGAPFLTTDLDLPFETGVTFDGQQYPQPHWWLTTSNEVQVFMLDTTANRVIDYVQFAGPNSVRDLTSEIITNWDAPFITFQASGSELWNTNYQSGLPISLVSQVGISMGTYTADATSGTWDQTDPTLLADEIAGFSTFMGYTPPPPYPSGGAEAIALAQTSLSNQVPYTPTATVVEHVSWQANDPLVHYTANDLNWPNAVIHDRNEVGLTNNNPNGTLGTLNQSYRPWGGNPLLPGADQNPFNLALKDPLVWRSDDWDFPAYKMPTVGWLGRVHRGTPWQTVYLKSPDILGEVQINGGTTNYLGTNYWVQWTGDAALASGQFYDAVNTAPAQDRLLFDNFTTAFNDNAKRGTLSVNVGASDPGNLQAGLAAWSALLSGVEVLSNSANDAVVGSVVQRNGSLENFTSFPINPAGPGGIGVALGQVVMGINQTRANVNTTDLIFNRTVSGTTTNEIEIPANFTNADGLVGAFEHVGDILGVPQLSDQSPFLNLNTNGVVDGTQLQNGISDEMYEWLPQQMMSLVRVSGTPQSPVRYVIYSYGQALKPAPNGIYTGNTTLANGQSAFGMVTNYQVVAEAATRTVLRYDGNRVENVIPIYNGTIVTNWSVVPSITNNQVVIERFNTLPSN